MLGGTGGVFYAVLRVERNDNGDDDDDSCGMYSRRWPGFLCCVSTLF